MADEIKKTQGVEQITDIDQIPASVLEEMSDNEGGDEGHE